MADLLEEVWRQIALARTTGVEDDEATMSHEEGVDLITPARARRDA